MSRIKLVVSDCDGTLVTPDKTLTAAAIAAVKKLDDAGIGFTVTSSRPPFGMRMLVSPLKLRLPLGPFNGSSLVTPALAPITQHLIGAKTARAALAVLSDFGVDAWLFTNDAWVVTRDDGQYVPHERHTIDYAPTVVQDFLAYLDRACKIVGASPDPALLGRCEDAMQETLGTSALVVRSQSYYLDVTPPGQDKGTFVDALIARLSLTRDDVAVLGDMQNDVAMFRRAGFSVAMGNAPDEVKAEASTATASNTDDGFAKGIDAILKRT